ncbi:hypothetical protein Tco_0374839 [Tanacetum coccineum]
MGSCNPRGCKNGRSRLLENLSGLCSEWCREMCRKEHHLVSPAVWENGLIKCTLREMAILLVERRITAGQRALWPAKCPSLVLAANRDAPVVGCGALAAGCDSLSHLAADCGNMMGKVDIDTLTIEHYLILTQGNQAPGMIKSEFRGMKKKTHRGHDYCLLPNINSFHHDKRRVVDHLHHSDDSKINAYYDLPPLLPYLKPVQPHTVYRHELLEEDTDYISDDE